WPVQWYVGCRAALGVPMLRDGNLVGVFFLSRSQPAPFTQDQIELVATFADQAVIAIENVRLFTELEARNREPTESLGPPTATSEILRVISRSQTDVQPVFDAIVQSAARLCDGTYCNVTRFDGELLHQMAVHDFTPEALAATRQRYPLPPTRRLGAGRAILDQAICHIPDVERDPEYDTALARVIGYRSVLAVPMFREGNPIRSIAVRPAPGGPVFPN